MADLFRETVIGEIGEQQGSKSLANVIEDNLVQLDFTLDAFRDYPRLKDCLDRFWLDNNYAEVMARIGDLIDSKKINDQTISDWWALTIQNVDGSDTVPLWCSYIFTLLAQRANERGEVDKGWALIASARYYTGLASSIIAVEEFKKKAKKDLERAKKGGEGKSIKYIDPVKKEVVRLLTALCPVGGWNNQTAAINAISSLDDLWTFVESLKSSASSEPFQKGENLADRIRGWIKNDPAVSAAYLENSAETIPAAKK